MRSPHIRYATTLMTLALALILGLLPCARGLAQFLPTNDDLSELKQELVRLEGVVADGDWHAQTELAATEVPMPPALGLSLPIFRVAYERTQAVPDRPVETVSAVYIDAGKSYELKIFRWGTAQPGTSSALRARPVAIFTKRMLAASAHTQKIADLPVELIVEATSFYASPGGGIRTQATKASVPGLRRDHAQHALRALETYAGLAETETGFVGAGESARALDTAPYATWLDPYWAEIDDRFARLHYQALLARVDWLDCLDKRDACGPERDAYARLDRERDRVWDRLASATRQVNPHPGALLATAGPSAPANGPADPLRSPKVAPKRTSAAGQGGQGFDLPGHACRAYNDGSSRAQVSCDQNSFSCEFNAQADDRVLATCTNGLTCRWDQGSVECQQ
jgi:hypothetical protein